jgi:2-polyprenyl-3-methyl-5-hydroxy-6-metoxy-1,4-benzoquinol methylase
MAESSIPVPVREMTVSSEYTVRDQERMDHARRYFEWQFAMAEKHLGARVLEVGCGLGNFTQHLIDREFVAGIDVEPLCIEKHRQRFAANANITSFSMDVLSPEFKQLARFNPASIACLNVLEHIIDDQLALAHMSAVLPRGGTVVLIVPAFAALYGPIDTLLGHYRRYSKKSLAQVARTAGFECRILRYLNSVGFFGWWCNARILKKTEQSTAQIKLFDSAVVPVLSRVERWIEPPVGQSVFAVLVKS